MHDACLNSHTGVTVNLSQPEYTIGEIDENVPLEVCVDIVSDDGVLCERDVVVALTTSDSTAGMFILITSKWSFTVRKTFKA